MTRGEPVRANCRCCKNEYNVNADGTIRYHLAADPECHESPSSRKCRGVGEPPEGTALPETATGYVCRIPAGPTGCGRPVALTANGRARSHLDNAGHPCPGGSDWPFVVDEHGNRTDTAPQGEVLPAAAPEELRFGSDDPVEDYLGTGRPEGIIGQLLRETGDPGTVADRLSDEQFAALVTQDDGSMDVYGRGRNGLPHPDAPRDGRTPEQQAEINRRMADPVGSALASLGRPGAPQSVDTGSELDYTDGTDAPVFDASHKVTDESGVEWVHPGEAENCTSPDCCTHPQGFTYADDGNGHSGSVCSLCGAEEPRPCTHPDGRVYGGTDENGDDVWICEACGGREDPAVTRMKAPRRARCTVADLDEGETFVRHTKAGSISRLVYRAGTPVMGALSATVVSAGPYAGRTGTLTDLSEEITCTDQNGRPRPRREAQASSAPVPAAVLPISKPQQTSSAAVPPASSTAGTSSRRSTAPNSRPATTASAPSAGATSSKATSSGPTATAATSTPSVPMTTDAQAAGDFLAAGAGSHGEAEAEYGRWGRYKLIHPHTGKTVEWTRATTFAKSISDTFTLAQWGKRNVLLGATMRSDIVALAHGKDIAKDRDQLNAWCEELEQAAGSKVAANMGTAVHSFTERVDRSWERRWEVLRDEVPDDFKPFIQAYIELLEHTGLVPVPHMIEFSTGVLQYEVMGTSDNCYMATRHLEMEMPRGVVRLEPGEHVIGDKKTGKDLDYGWQEICIQLGLYAQGVNTLGLFDWGTKTWDPEPLSRVAEPGTKVRTDVGVILHIPVDPRSKKKPGIHGVDLESGWNAAVLCERVRTWRKLRTLNGPVAVVDADPMASAELPSPAPGTVRPPTLRERAEQVTSNPEASAVYQDAVKAKVPVAELNELIAVMQEVIKRVAEPGGARV
jgi:hypothetical protein